MRVLLAGGSGAIGLPLVRRLRAAGHDVVATSRSARGRELLSAAGATPVRVDVLDRGALDAALEGHRFDAVIAQLSALRKTPARHRDLAATNRLRVEGTANLLAAAARSGAQRFLTQSMVFGYGYGDLGDRVYTEADPFAPPGRGRFEEHLAAMRSNEEQVLGASSLEGVALRYGLFYGPGAAGDATVAALRRRRLPVVRDGGRKPLIQVDDAAAATVAALEHGRAGSAYDVTDDQPASLSELLVAIAAAVGAPSPWRVPSWLLTPVPYAKAIMTGDLRVSSSRAKHELGWTPRYPTYRDGVAELARHYRGAA